MRQNANVTLFILVLTLFGLSVVHCGKPGENSDRKVAEQLLEYFNSNIPGTQFKTNLENCMVKPADNNYYWVTFKNLSTASDFYEIIKQVGKSYPQKGESFGEMPYKHRIEEVLALYNPRKRYVSFGVMKGISVEHDAPGLEGKEESPMNRELKINRTRISMGKMTIYNWDIDDMPKPGKNTPPELVEEFEKGKVRPFGATIENVELETNWTVNKKDSLTILLEIDKLENSSMEDFDKDVLRYMFQKDAPVPDLSKTLQKTLSVSDLALESGEIKVSIKKNENRWGYGAVKNVSFSFFLKADETRKYFKLGFGFGIKNLKLSIPGKREIELASNIKDFRFLFSLEHLSPEAILAFINILKKYYDSRKSGDDPGENEITFLIMKFFTEFIKSKGVLKVSISPLKHHFGELSAQLEATRSDLLSPPEGKIRVNILKIDEMLKKLKESNLVSPTVLKEISATVEKYMVRKEDGSASMALETKAHQPGKYFLNGKLMWR